MWNDLTCDVEWIKTRQLLQNQSFFKQMNRGRFSAQGPESLGERGPIIEKSSAWATNNIIYKEIGQIHIDEVEIQLTPVELKNRDLAIQKARNFVEKAPNEGVFGLLRKTFNNTPQHRAVRFDVDVFEGSAFVTKQ